MIVVRDSYDVLGAWGQPLTTYEVIGKFSGQVCSLELNFYDPVTLPLQPGTILSCNVTKVTEYEGSETVREFLKVNLTKEEESNFQNSISNFNELKVEILTLFLNEDLEQLYYAAYRINHLDGKELKSLIEIIQQNSFISELVLLGLGSMTDNVGDNHEELWYTNITPVPLQGNHSKSPRRFKVYTPRDLLNFGKNIGKRLDQVYKYHPEYIEWLIEHHKLFAIDIALFRALPKPTVLKQAIPKSEIDKRIKQRSDSFITIDVILDMINRGSQTVEIDFEFSEGIIRLNQNKIMRANMYYGFNSAIDYRDNVNDGGCPRCQGSPCICSDPDPG